MLKNKKIKLVFSILILIIAIVILYKILKTTYFIQLFFGLSVGSIVIFINWSLNRKKVAQINNIIAIIEEIHKTWKLNYRRCLW
jgi:hypothetical protein